jgi:hypothetical protein
MITIKKEDLENYSENEIKNELQIFFNEILEEIEKKDNIKLEIKIYSIRENYHVELLVNSMFSNFICNDIFNFEGYLKDIYLYKNNIKRNLYFFQRDIEQFNYIIDSKYPTSVKNNSIYM